jgi:hypothetical protein
LARQSQRVDRLKADGRDPAKAIRLLKILEARAQRSSRYLDMVLGWSRTHHGKKFPRALKTPFINPRASRAQREGKLSLWDKRVRSALDKQFAEAPNYKASIVALWEKYVALGLPNKHFVSELSSGKKEVVMQRVWEMMLARHFDALGYTVTTSDEGPDFKIQHGGKTIWIEAICPEPKGVPQHYLEGPKPGEFKVGDVPHTEVLLRWTAAIKEKRDKLKTYRAKGIVKDGDGYIVAVNGCQLGALPIGQGVSQFPYAVEAVYPAGPISIPVDRATGQFGTPFVSLRPTIDNARGAAVPTTVFLDKANAGVSAVVAFSGDRSESPLLPLDVVHNHFASVPIPTGILGADTDEWVTEPDGKTGINVLKLNAPEQAAN